MFLRLPLTSREYESLMSSSTLMVILEVGTRWVFLFSLFEWENLPDAPFICYSQLLLLKPNITHHIDPELFTRYHRPRKSQFSLAKALVWVPLATSFPSWQMSQSVNTRLFPDFLIKVSTWMYEFNFTGEKYSLYRLIEALLIGVTLRMPMVVTMSTRELMAPPCMVPWRLAVSSGTLNVKATLLGSSSYLGSNTKLLQKSSRKEFLMLGLLMNFRKRGCMMVENDDTIGGYG